VQSLLWLLGLTTLTQLSSVMRRPRSDPQSMQEIVGALYTDAAFYQALYNSLSPDGLLVSQVGQSPDPLSPPDDYSINRHLAGFTQGLSEQGFEIIRQYSEVRTGEKHMICCIVIMTARLTDFAPCNRMAVVSIYRGLSW
jgi:hypothetical protein